MKIDIHVHASERSNCALSSEEEMVKSAIDYGLDAIVFTDHNKFIDDKRLSELNSKYSPFRIFKGIEVSVPKEHVLVIGIADEVLQSENWNYEDLHKYVRANGGFICLAHPFRYRNYINADLERYPPDAMETHSISARAENRPEIDRLIEIYGLRDIRNSDGHHTEHVGIFYNVLNHTPKDERELAEILKAGEYSSTGMQERIDAFNQMVRELEDLAKSLYRQGKGARDFYELTGLSEARFKKVIDGGSYKI